MQPPILIIRPEPAASATQAAAAALGFDRDAAQGMRLNIASGLAVRFEPGQQRTVELVEIGGARVIYGFRGLIQGAL